MAKSKIEWTDVVWNPVTGCNKVSRGCKHCYAETIANRFWAKQYPQNADGSPRRFTDVRLHPERLDEPLRLKTPRRVFVNSMSDLFHETVDRHFIADVWRVMEKTPQHVYQVLTKRSERMWHWVTGYALYDKPLPNVWLGVSVENQQAADERIPWLLQTPAAVRFVSCEPLLGSVDFSSIGSVGMGQCLECAGAGETAGHYFSPDGVGVCGSCGGSGEDSNAVLDWVIVGGESGPGARPMHPDWARSLRDQCQAGGVPFFFKQWGEFGSTGTNLLTDEPVFLQYQNYDHWTQKYWMAKDDILLDATGERMLNGGMIKVAIPPFTIMRRVGKRAAGRLLDGREWNEFPC
ncbi:MAG: phage Gp37/Gp68 family protein [Candidatus Omnitrophota bacterium]|jgi:protein gp37|nr:MAG: phage Gp37/Gp68 family protein [Candidatus Omnitrophota bacterium]